MDKFKLIWTPIIAVIIFSVLIAFAPMFSDSATGMKNLAPFTDYTYASYANTTSGVINTTTKITRTVAVSEAKNSDITKLENLTMYFQNVHPTYIIGNITFNGNYLGTVNLTAGAVTIDTYLSRTCLNGQNTLQFGALTSSINATFLNFTLKCATTLNGTDYSWVVGVGVLALAISILVTILMFSGILELKIFK